MYSILISSKPLGRFAFLFTTMVLINVLIFYMGKDDLIGHNLNDESNQATLKNSEVKFREAILTKYNNIKFDSLFHSAKISFLDSSQNGVLLKAFMILKFTESLKDTTVYVKNHLSFFYDLPILSFDSLRIAIKLDRISLDSMLATASGQDQTAYILRYGNYTKQEMQMLRKLKASGLLLTLLVCYLGSLLSIYVGEILKKRLRDRARGKKELLTVAQVLDRAKAILEESKPKGASNEGVEKISMDAIYLQQLITELDSLKSKKETKRVLIEDLASFRIKANDIYERASLFLIFSFLISIFGVFIFYSLLPEYKESFKLSEYLGFSIRPFVILVFFQSLAVYLLKQYKNSIEDYKFFHSEFKNRKRFLMVYEILEHQEQAQVEQIISMELLKERDSRVSTDAADDEKINEAPINSIYESYIKLLGTASK